jgi:hypothetical protein
MPLDVAHAKGAMESTFHEHLGGLRSGILSQVQKFEFALLHQIIQLFLKVLWRVLFRT